MHGAGKPVWPTSKPPCTRTGRGLRLAHTSRAVRRRPDRLRRRDRLRSWPSTAGDRNALIKACANLAVLHSRDGRFAQAEEQFEQIEKDVPRSRRPGQSHTAALLIPARHEPAGTRALRRGGADARRRASRLGSPTLGADNPHTARSTRWAWPGWHALRCPALRRPVPLLQRRLRRVRPTVRLRTVTYTVDARNALAVRAAVLRRTGAAASGTSRRQSVPACPSRKAVAGCLLHRPPAERLGSRSAVRPARRGSARFPAARCSPSATACASSGA